METSAVRGYTFGDFSIVADEKILRRDGEIVSLPAKIFEILNLLVEARGAVVSKETIMQAVWPDSFVEESNLTQSIYALRRTLGRNAEGNNFIETLPKRGYRLAVPVAVIADPEAALAPIDADQPRTVEQNETRRDRLRVLRPLAIAALVLLAITATSLLAARFLVPKTGAPVEHVSFQRLTFSGDITFPIISPDGKSFAYVRGDSIYLQDIATGSSVKLEVPGHKKFGNLQFSSAGEFIYFRDEDSFDADGRLYQVSRFGGTAKQVAERAWSGVGESADGSTLAFIRFYPTEGQWALILHERSSGAERKLFTTNLPYTIYRSGHPVFSPDAKQIAIVEQTPETGNVSRILSVDVATGETKQLDTPQFVQIEQLGWLPDGRGLLITGRENNRFFQLWRMSLPGGELSRITNDLNIYRNLSVSSDGKRLVARQYSIYSHIWTAPADDLAKLKQITFGNLNRDGNAGLVTAPDGSVIYATRITGNIDLWSVRPSDGLRKQLTENAGPNNENPFVTADGKYIFYESTRSGRRKIWRSDIDGANPTQITTDKDELDFLPAVSPDGAYLYYISRNPRSNVLWRQSLSDGSRINLTQQGKIAPEGFLAISPDGGTLAFRTLAEDSQTDTTNVNLLDLATGQIRALKIETQASAFTFSDNGSSMDYSEYGPNDSKLWRVSVTGSTPPRLLAEIPNARVFDMSWSFDQKTLSLSRGRQDNDAILLSNFD